MAKLFENDLSLQKKVILHHINYITKLNDAILNQLLISETNRYGFASIVIIDVVIN